MPVNTIDLYHFILLSAALTLAEGHQVSLGTCPETIVHKFCHKRSVPEMIIIIIIITFKGAIQYFLQSPHCAANCLQHVRSSGPGAIVCKSRATHQALITCKCHVTCHLVRRDSSAIKFDRVEVAFDEGGEKTGVPGENPWRRASENATYYSPKIHTPSEHGTRAVALVAG